MLQLSHTLTVFGLLLGTAIALTPRAAIARTCQAARPAPASPELKAFDIDEFDLTLTIPSNYRSMLRSSGHITFHDPNSFAFIQCLVRAGEYGAVPPYVALEIHPGATPQTNLIEIVRTKRPWLDYYSPDYEPIEFAGHTALLYTYANPVYQLAIANISFLSADGQTLLTLTGPNDHPILTDSLLTLSAPSPLSTSSP